MRNVSASKHLIRNVSDQKCLSFEISHIKKVPALKYLRSEMSHIQIILFKKCLSIDSGRTLMNIPFMEEQFMTVVTLLQEMKRARRMFKQIDCDNLQERGVEEGEHEHHRRRQRHRKH